MLGFTKDTILRQGQPYLRRWMFRCKLFSVRLHHFVGEDPDHFHDHPWSFVSLLIKGGYVESIRHRVGFTRWETRTVFRLQPMVWAYRHRLTRHRVETLPEGAWTLVLTGPELREWGFWLTDDFFVEHEHYDEVFNQPLHETGG